MILRALILFLGILCSGPIWCFTCYFTLAKDSCWISYNVSVDVLDAQTDRVLTTVEVPAAKAWTRQAFTCDASQKLMYKARFTPAFWKSETGKIYSAQNYWSLPAAINTGDTAWNISVCYPADFSEVPFPPDAKGNCRCDFTVIPSLKPQ